MCVFSASELIYAASLLKFNVLYGIPDVISSAPEEYRSEIIHDSMQSLMSKHCLDMDMDGNFSVGKELAEILAYCSLCDAVLSVSVRTEDDIEDIRVLWRYKDLYLQGIVVDNSYQFFFLTEQEVRNVLGLYSELKPCSADVETITVPYTILRKIKRFQKHADVFNATKQVMAYGASYEFAEDIALSLLELNAFHMYSLTLTNGENIENKGIAFSEAAHSYVVIRQETEDFKTNVVFSKASSDELKAKIATVFSEFLLKTEV